MKLLQLSVQYDEHTINSVYFPLSSVVVIEQLPGDKARIWLTNEQQITPNETMTDILNLIGEMDETLVITYKDTSGPPKDIVNIIITDEGHTNAKN